MNRKLLLLAIVGLLDENVLRTWLWVSIYINQSLATRSVIDQTECCLLHVRSKALKIFAKI